MTNHDPRLYVGTGRKSWITEDELNFLEYLGTWRDGNGSGKHLDRMSLLTKYRDEVMKLPKEWGKVNREQVEQTLERLLTQD
jgi:hypothetical protein